jgi:hypothetical protein
MRGPAARLTSSTIVCRTMILLFECRIPKRLDKSHEQLGKVRQAYDERLFVGRSVPDLGNVLGTDAELAIAHVRRCSRIVGKHSRRTHSDHYARNDWITHMADGRMTEGHCAQCRCKRPDLGWFGVEYDDQFEKAIRFWCWPACMVEWNDQKAQTKEINNGRFR